MDQLRAFSPTLLQNQATRLQSERVAACSLSVPDTLLTVVRQAQNRPAWIQRLLAYRVPTRQLEHLLQLVLESEDPDQRQTALILLAVRLHRRLVWPIWALFQDNPDRSELCSLLEQLVATAQPQRSDERSDPAADLIDWIRQAALLEQPQNRHASADLSQLAERIIAYLLQTDLSAHRWTEAIGARHLNPDSPMIQEALGRYFSDCSEESFQLNLAVLRNYLVTNQPPRQFWMVANQYYQTVRPNWLDDSIGEWVQSALGADQTAEESTTLTHTLAPAFTLTLEPVAQRHFEIWQILHSLRNQLKHPRQVELLSRYADLITDPARPMQLATTGETVGSLVKIQNLRLVARPGDDSLYLYGENLFAFALDEANRNQVASWDFKSLTIVPARDILLEEQEKKPEDRTLVDLLYHNQIESIIQLELDDAQYLFARKVLDELSAYLGIFRWSS